MCTKIKNQERKIALRWQTYLVTCRLIQFYLQLEPHSSPHLLHPPTSVAGLPELSDCFRCAKSPRRALSSEQQQDPHSAHDCIPKPCEEKRVRLRPLWVAATILQGASQTGRHKVQNSLSCLHQASRLVLYRSPPAWYALEC